MTQLDDADEALGHTPTQREVVVCSFHTPDEYYAGHARELRAQLELLGLPHELLEVEKVEGEDWADVTRRKIGFIHDVCQRHPDAMVFWIDVDCRITELPDYVRNSTADFIGFQRSFRSPLHIGYESRTRFWEPSFWGVNATPQGRRLVQDAFALEQRSSLKATDDYFLEEAWRTNARYLTFQMIPAVAVVRRRSRREPLARNSFFVFGSSGNVAEFKSKVVQHGGKSTTSTRKKLLGHAKEIERALPEDARRPLRRMVDNVGLTGVLTSDSQRGPDPERRKSLNAMLGAGMAGDRVAHRTARREFEDKHIATEAEEITLEAAEAFLEYSARGSDRTLLLSWWSKPFPGNFGDWLSPLLVGAHTDANIRLQPVTKTTRRRHMFALGSIGRFIRPNSVVVGTGISRPDIDLSRRATYVSVRGPITAQVLRESGGPQIDAFGDPAVLLSRVLPIERGHTNGRIALVRHFSHARIPIATSDRIDEVSVLMSRRADIESFVQTLGQYDAVVTSAMHVMIACQSYGIPCGLITFEGFESFVHGTGVKYEDYARGVDVEVINPQLVGLDQKAWDLDSLIRDTRVSESIKDDVEAHVRSAVVRVLEAGSARGIGAQGKNPKIAKK